MAEDKRRFTEMDDQVIREAVAKKMMIKDIAALLGRTKDSIASRMHKLGLTLDKYATPANLAKRATREQAGDAKFVKAMLAAIKSGEEHAILGVVKRSHNRNPIFLRHVSQTAGIRSSADYDL